MKQDQDVKSTERRAFMKAGLGVGAAGAVAIGLSSVSNAAVSETELRSGSKGYRETEHVARFYASARF